METATEPRSRNWALVVPVVLTLLLGALVGGYVVYENQRQSERIAVADEAGATYLAEVASFRGVIDKALEGVEEEDPVALREALTGAWGEPPTLAEVDPQIASESSTYVEAQRVAADLLAPYEEFDAALERAAAAQEFTAAASEVLALDVNDYVEGTTLYSSTSLRQNLLPAFIQARANFSEVAVPEGAEEAAQLTLAALQDVIDGATQLAASIEGNRNYTFTVGEAHQAAAQAVNDFEAQSNGDFTEAFTRIRDLAGE